MNIQIDETTLPVAMRRVKYCALQAILKVLTARGSVPRSLWYIGLALAAVISLGNPPIIVLCGSVAEGAINLLAHPQLPELFIWIIPILSWFLSFGLYLFLYSPLRWLSRSAGVWVQSAAFVLYTSVYVVLWICSLVPLAQLH